MITTVMNSYITGERKVLYGSTEEEKTCIEFYEYDVCVMTLVLENRKLMDFNSKLFQKLRINQVIERFIEEGADLEDFTYRDFIERGKTCWRCSLTLKEYKDYNGKIEVVIDYDARWYSKAIINSATLVLSSRIMHKFPFSHLPYLSTSDLVLLVGYETTIHTIPILEDSRLFTSNMERYIIEHVTPERILQTGMIKNKDILNLSDETKKIIAKAKLTGTYLSISEVTDSGDLVFSK